MPDAGQIPSKCYFLSSFAGWNITTFLLPRRLSSAKQRNLCILSGIHPESLHFRGKILDSRITAGLAIVVPFGSSYSFELSPWASFS